MEYILNNTLLALLDYPGTTLLGINRLLADDDYRKRVVANLKDPVVKAFWQNEFASYNDKYRQEAVAPIQNKIGQFLSASVIRNIVAQVKSRIDIREIMDSKKIFIMNLSKGRIGEDNSRLLGGMLITKLQLAAMERVDTPEKDRKDFFLYVDEFQNFATESFANILSEARKYRLDLTMAHQYMEQLDENVLAAVIGNVGSLLTFRVGSTDAEILAKEFAPTFVEEDLINLPKYHIYLKLMIDGIASRPFSALTLPPIAQTTHSTEKVVKVSRERYAVPRENIEDKIARWSGMVVIPDDEASELEVDDDEAMFAPIKKTEKPKEEKKPIENKPVAQQPALAKENIKPTKKHDKPVAPFVSTQKHNNPPNNNGGHHGDKNKNKKHGGQPQASVTTTPLSLVDTSQKGISLSSLVSPKKEIDRPVEKPVAPSPAKFEETKKEKVENIAPVKTVVPETKPLGPETIGLLPKEQHQNPPVNSRGQFRQPVKILPDQVHKIKD